MPSIPSPSQLINCDNLASCFQNLYNLLFSFVVAIAFIYFIFGAIEYLFSGVSVSSQEAGKRKMVNAVIGLILAMIIPVFLYMINPEIFQLTWNIPIVTVQLPDIPENFTDEDIARLEKNAPQYVITNPPTKITPKIPLGEIKDITKVFKRGELTNISASNNEGPNHNLPEKINEGMRNIILRFNEELRNRKVKAIITDCYDPYEHASKGHTVYGTSCDVVPNPKSKWAWEKVCEAAKAAGFKRILYEAPSSKCLNCGGKTICGILTSKTTGEHFHLEAY